MIFGHWWPHIEAKNIRVNWGNLMQSGAMKISTQRDGVRRKAPKIATELAGVSVRLLGWKDMDGLATFRHMDAYSREYTGDATSLMALVEQETGYRVTVGTVEIENADAEMVSAAPSHPAHMIKVSTRCLPMGGGLCHCLAVRHPPDPLVPPPGCPDVPDRPRQGRLRCPQGHQPPGTGQTTRWHGRAGGIFPRGWSAPPALLYPGRNHLRGLLPPRMPRLAENRGRA